MAKKPAEDTRTARELLQTLRGRGLTYRELGNELQRDPRMIRKVLDGEIPGRPYVQTLRELVDNGQAETLPPRRRNKAGEIVRVRGTERGKSVIPQDTGGRYTDEKQGGRYVKTAYGRDGVRIINTRIPKGKNTKGRAAATNDLLDSVRSAARGQSKTTQKRVTMRVTFANGRTMEVNDYNASTLLDRINTHGAKDILGWLTGQMSKRYSNLDTSTQAITGVTMNVYSKDRTDRSSRPYSARGEED